MKMDDILVTLDAILERFDQEYYNQLEKNNQFPQEIITEFQKNKLMTLFLHQSFGGNNLGLSEYIQFQDKLLAKDTSLALIYNQHVSFLKYLEGIPVNPFTEKLTADLVQEQKLCTLALAENGSLDFFSRTPFSQNKVTKKAVISAGAADYYLINFLKEGGEFFAVASKEDILESKELALEGLTSAVLMDVTFDLANNSFAVLDEKQQTFRKYVLPLMSLFLTKAFSKAAEHIHDKVKKDINYTYIDFLQKYSFEIDSVRNSYMLFKLKNDAIQNNLNWLLTSALNNPIKLIEGRLISLDMYNQLVYDYSKFTSFEDYVVSSKISKLIRDTNGLRFISPAPSTLINTLSKFHFNIAR